MNIVLTKMVPEENDSKRNIQFKWIKKEESNKRITQEKKINQ